MIPVPVALRLVDFSVPAELPDAQVIDIEYDHCDRGVLSENQNDTDQIDTGQTDTGQTDTGQTDQREEDFRMVRSELQAEWETERAVLNAQMEERIQADRDQWKATHADAITGQIDAKFDEVQASICQWIAEIAGPVLTNSVRVRALEELEATVAQLSRKSLMIKISGPQELLDALRLRLGDSYSVEWSPKDQNELQIKADCTVVKTCITGWLEKLREHES